MAGFTFSSSVLALHNRHDIRYLIALCTVNVAFDKPPGPGQARFVPYDSTREIARRSQLLDHRSARHVHFDLMQRYHAQANCLR